MDLPLIGYFPPTPLPDAGLAPDQAIAFSAAGHDPPMARALVCVGVA